MGPVSPLSCKSRLQKPVFNIMRNSGTRCSSLSGLVLFVPPEAMPSSSGSTTFSRALSIRRPIPSPLAERRERGGTFFHGLLPENIPTCGGPTLSCLKSCRPVSILLRNWDLSASFFNAGQTQCSRRGRPEQHLSQRWVSFFLFREMGRF